MKEINFSREWRRTGERLAVCWTWRSRALLYSGMPNNKFTRTTRSSPNTRSSDGDQMGNKETDITRIKPRDTGRYNEYAVAAESFAFQIVYSSRRVVFLATLVPRE